MTLTVGSLFSGIGGFDLGLERAGMRVEWQVENNAFCRKVLQKHWPKVPCHYDITTIDWEFIPRVDLVCGGWPCQPFSCAGKRRGTADDRYLWHEVVRCLDTLRPTWFLGENVPNIINMGIERMCADLEAIGYQVTLLGIPACAVGAPHIRQRIWLVAHYQRERVERVIEETIQKQPALPRSKNVRRTSHFRDMPAISEPLVCRMGNGIPHLVDRLKGLGNAVVPQIVEALGRMIVEVDHETTRH